MSANEFATRYLGKFNIPDLVKVRFESLRNPGTFDGGAYTYIAEQHLTVGDIVNCPTRYGERQAQVVRTDVPISDVECRIGQLRKIAGPAIPKGDLFAGFFD